MRQSLYGMLLCISLLCRLPRDPHNFPSAISCARQVCVVKNSRVLGNDDFLVPELKMLTFMPSLESSIIPTSIPIEGDHIERTIPATSWPKLTAVCSEG